MFGRRWEGGIGSTPNVLAGVAGIKLRIAEVLLQPMVFWRSLYFAFGYKLFINAGGRERQRSKLSDPACPPLRGRPSANRSETIIIGAAPNDNHGHPAIPEQKSDEVRFAHSPRFLLQDLSLSISDDRGWRGADMVTTQRCDRPRIIDVNRHEDKPCVDRGLHLLIRPDAAFHDSTGNAPLGGEEEDHGLAGLGSLLLSRGVIVGPGDLVGGDVEVVPCPTEADNEGAEPEPAPKVELASMGL